MMKNKQLLAAGLALLMLPVLAGCRLAREDVAQSTDDKLIGVLITPEYLDLFDWDAYLNAHSGQIGGGEIDGADRQQDRLYAELLQRTLTNEETGKTEQVSEYVFDSVDGMAFFVATVQGTDDADSYTTSNADPAISDGNIGISVTDEGEALTLEATVYLSAGTAIRTYYVNPIYQSADGSVYAVSGDGLSFDGNSAGMSCSQKLEQTSTVTENGKSEQDSASIALAFTVVDAPERIVVLQMDGSSVLVSREEYVPGALPDALPLSEKTAYMVVETHAKDAAGEPVVSRVLLGADSQWMETLYGRDDGVCAKQSTRLDWREGSSAQRG